jgi:hypothetical protein
MTLRLSATHTRHLGAATLLLLAAACAQPRLVTADNTPAPDGADSLVLERAPCYGTCPVYRLSIASDGAVRLESRARADSGRTHEGRMSAAAFAELVAGADSMGFFTFPARIAEDPALCGIRATDHPTATVTIHRATGTHSVEDYHGCHGPADAPAIRERLQRLRAWESVIDSVAGTGRWLADSSGR